MKKSLNKNQESATKNQESTTKNQESTIKKQESATKNQKNTGGQRGLQKLNIIKGLKSRVRIEIEGLNQAKLFNTLLGKVPLKNINKVSQRVVRVDVSKKDAQKTFAILEKMCYNYKVVAEGGSRILFFNALSHAGLILSLILFVSMAIVLSNMVWKVEISGNTRLDSIIVEKALKEAGVKVGWFKSKVNKDKASDILRGLDGVADGTVELVGTTLKVNILEEKEYIPPKDNTEPCDIISNYDAEITKIITLRGTKAVNVGQRVAKGATLIKGEVYNTAGEVLQEVAAEGEVYGRVAFKSTYVFSKTEVTTVRTGKEKKYTSLGLFGLKIGKNPALNWEKEVSEIKLGIIPIKVTRTVYYETRIVESQRDLALTKESLEAKAIAENSILAGNSNVDCTSTLVPLDGDMFMLNVYISAEILIN